MEECKVDDRASKQTYDELVAGMKDDLYWVRFFARPCCPAPDLEGAAEMLDRLIGEVEARGDFSDEQKAELSALIASRKDWYATSGLCRGSRG